jgi:hypothetical protein
LFKKEGNNRLQQPINHLQVVDGPDTKGNGESDTTEREEKNGSISTVQSRSNTVSNLLGITTARSRALRATESVSLFFKEHSSAFLLQIMQIYKTELQFVRYLTNLLGKANEDTAPIQALTLL